MIATMTSVDEQIRDALCNRLKRSAKTALRSGRSG